MLQLLLSFADESDHEKIIYIYKHYHDEMVRFAKHRLYMARVANYETDAEDVVQDSFLKITKYIKSINLDVSERELKSYILSIVSNVLADRFKKAEHVEDLEDHFDIKSDDNFVEELTILERYKKVVAAIEKMEEKYRLALVYHFYKGFSVKEMAELFEVPEKTIYTRISRAQKKLKEMLEEGN